MKLLTFVMLFFASVAFANDTKNQISIKKDDVPVAKKNWKMKTELKSSSFVFDDETDTQLKTRLRLEPSVKFGRYFAGFRQDISQKVKDDETSYSAKNMRTFVGWQAIKLSKNLKIEPRFELWLPVNEEDRLDNEMYAAPGFSTKLKYKTAGFQAKFENNLRSRYYNNKQRVGEENTDVVKMFNELELYYVPASKLKVGSTFKIKDDWNRSGQWEQDYSWSQEIIYKLSSQWSMELGHEIDKKVVRRGESRVATELYNDELSTAYMLIKHQY